MHDFRPRTPIRLVTRFHPRSARVVAVGLAIAAVAIVAGPGPAGAAGIEPGSSPAVVERAQRCERRGIERVLELRSGPDGAVPCEVVYLKPDEDRSARVMWKARRDVEYCGDRFEEFVIKLETKLAWHCEPAAQAAVKQAETAPELGRALESPVFPRRSITGTAAGPGRRADAATTPAERLRRLVPSGHYVLLEAAPAAPGVESSCPPGGLFLWNTRQPERPVFELGREAALAVDARALVFDEPLRLLADEAGPPPADARAGSRAGVEDAPRYRLGALSVSRAGADADVGAGAGTGGTPILAVELDRSDDDGSVRQAVCRYAAGG